MTKQRVCNLDGAEARVSRYERFDHAALKPPQRLDSGFLRVEGRIARVGVQEYHRADGTVHRELRLPEEVFSEKSLASFQQVPVTNTHPPGMLTAKNAKQYSVGAVGENVRADGVYVAAPLMITDADAIAAVEAGRSQLSNGYSCWLEERVDAALVAQWGAYDAIQRDIVGNHVALVDAARAGAGACLRLDAAAAASGWGDSEFATATSDVVASDQRNVPTWELTKMPHKFKLDGFDLEVADANHQSIIERCLASARKDGEDKAAAAVLAQKAAEKLRDEAQAKFDTLNAKGDEVVKCVECKGVQKLDGKDCVTCAGKGEYAAKLDTAERRDGAIARMVARSTQARAALVVEAARILGANEKLDALDDLAVKKLVVAKLSPAIKLDGQSEAYIRAAYDVAVAAQPKRAPIDTARAVATGGPTGTGDAPTLTVVKDEAPTDPNAARDAMIKRTTEANAAMRAKK